MCVYVCICHVCTSICMYVLIYIIYIIYVIYNIYRTRTKLTATALVAQSAEHWPRDPLAVTFFATGPVGS